MDFVQSFCHIRPRIGHVIVYCIGWILDRPPRTKETLSDFVKFWIPVNGTQWSNIELHNIHRHSAG